MSFSHLFVAVLSAAPTPTSEPANTKSDGAILREHLRADYPSLAYVDRYRQDFPEERLGDDTLWNGKAPPELADRDSLVRSLVALADQHVALTGPKTAPTETLGVLFRSSGDGHLIVWRVFAPTVQDVHGGDLVLAIDGEPVADWLRRTSELTFGGNRRSRAAEATLNLGLGSRGVHETTGLKPQVTLTVSTGEAAPREVVLPYVKVDEALAAAMTAAINAADLPKSFTSNGVRVGTLRLGAFAPQYDSAFISASDAAAAKPGTSEDQAMLAGFCAVVRNFIAEANARSVRSDLLVLDLRGNLGGFGREARLLAEALAPGKLPVSIDVFASGKAGTVTLTRQPNDTSCGHVAKSLPLVVLTDAGTRSAGELMAAWLWSAGATIAGERTVGAGGGFEFGSSGFTLPHSGYGVRFSGNFTLFDPPGTLKAGELSEASLVATVAADGFAPSHKRAFAIQAVGVRPDLASSPTLADLRDGGRAEVEALVAAWKKGAKAR